MTNGKRKALGRGLSALIPEPEGEVQVGPGVATLAPVDRLDPNPFQPRSAIDPERLAEIRKEALKRTEGT